MLTPVPCPRCRRSLGIPASLLGQEVRCASCLTDFVARPAVAADDLPVFPAAPPEPERPPARPGAAPRPPPAPPPPPGPSSPRTPGPSVPLVVGLWLLALSLGGLAVGAGLFVSLGDNRPNPVAVQPANPGAADV